MTSQNRIDAHQADKFIRGARGAMARARRDPWCSAAPISTARTHARDAHFFGYRSQDPAIIKRVNKLVDDLENIDTVIRRLRNVPLGGAAR